MTEAQRARAFNPSFSDIPNTMCLYYSIIREWPRHSELEPSILHSVTSLILCVYITVSSESDRGTASSSLQSFIQWTSLITMCLYYSIIREWPRHSELEPSILHSLTSLILCVYITVSSERTEAQRARAFNPSFIDIPNAVCLYYSIIREWPRYSELEPSILHSVTSLMLCIYITVSSESDRGTASSSLQSFIQWHP